MKKRFRIVGLLLICSLFLVMLFSGQALAIRQAMPVSPGDSSGNAVTEQACPTFSWSLVAEAVSYRVEVYEQATADLLPYEAMSTVANPLVSKDIAAPALTWTPSAGECLDRGMKYAWYVIGVDQDGEGVWSYGKGFEIEASALTLEQKDAVQEVVKEYLTKQAAESAALTAAKPDPAAAVTITRQSEPPAKKSADSGIQAQSIQPQSLTSVGVQILDNLNVSGNLVLPATTATAGVIMSGANTLIHSYGSGNFFAGINAGNLTMTSGIFGGNNTATGAYALTANTTGTDNTATGAYALTANTTGTDNTATGAYALTANTTGFENTASGVAALYFNTTGYNNTATGGEALYSNTTGYNNTATGVEALVDNTTGFENTASGVAALYSNTTGNQNTANGYLALGFNTTASKNTAVGTSSLFTQSYNPGAAWDSHNTAVGFEALYSNQPTSVAEGFANTAIGALALRTNTTGYRNTAGGLNALYFNTTGGDNTAIGYNALVSNTTGSLNTAIGYAANVSSGNLMNATAIGYGAEVNSSNKVRIGNNEVTVIQGQVGWSYPSDIRIKKDVEDIGFGLAFIKSLRPVQYRLIQGNDRIDFGFIAQEVEARLGTDYNVLGIAEDADRSLSLRYTDFIAPMVKAMQEQQEKIEVLEARLARLEALLGAGN